MPKYCDDAVGTVSTALKAAGDLVGSKGCRRAGEDVADEADLVETVSGP